MELTIEPRLRASFGQFDVLLRYMEEHGDPAKLRLGPHDRMKADRMWEELTPILNDMKGGVTKSVDKWKKVWADWKAKTKKKYFLIRQNVRNASLTPFEERLLAIMARNDPGPRMPLPHKEIEDPLLLEEEEEEEKEKEEEEDENDVMDKTETIAYQTSTSEEQLQPTVEVSVARLEWEIPKDNIDFIQILQQPSTSSVGNASPPVKTPSQPDPEPPQQASSKRTRHPRRLRRYTPVDPTRWFMAVEHRRIRLEEKRLRDLHLREMERMRVESQRILVHSDFVRVMRRLTDVMDNWLNRNVMVPKPEAEWS